MGEFATTFLAVERVELNRTIASTAKACTMDVRLQPLATLALFSLALPLATANSSNSL